MFLHAWAQAYICSLHSCICRFVLAYASMFLRFCVRGNKLAYAGVLSACVGLDLCTWDAWQKPCSAHFHLFFTRFTSLCNANTYFCYLCIWISLHHSFYLHLCITIPFSSNFTWIMNLMTPFPFLQLSSLYVGRGSTNKVVEWFNLLALETRGYV